MSTKKSGDLFGEDAVFSEANSYPFNVVAKIESSILLFSKDEFFKLLTLDNSILENFLKIISIDNSNLIHIVDFDKLESIILN